jgi:hypothetical protein
MALGGIWSAYKQKELGSGVWELSFAGNGFTTP